MIPMAPTKATMAMQKASQSGATQYLPISEPPLFEGIGVRVKQNEIVVGEQHLPITLTTRTWLEKRKPGLWFPVTVATSGCGFVLLGAFMGLPGRGMIVTGLSWVVLAALWARRSKAPSVLCVGDRERRLEVMSTQDVDLVSQFLDAMLIARQCDPSVMKDRKPHQSMTA
jgi:hypothetical protein